MGVAVREKVRGSGEWWIFIKHNGKRKSKKIGSKALAKEIAKKIEARLVLGDMDLDEKPENEESRIPAFKAYSALWLESYIRAIAKEKHSRAI